MPQFQKGNTAGRGRPRGSRNVRATVPASLTKRALEKLTEAVEAGESWACQEVLKRVYPCLKPITPENSLDGGLMQLKIKELESFEQRLILLEDQQN